MDYVLEAARKGCRILVRRPKTTGEVRFGMNDCRIRSLNLDKAFAASGFLAATGDKDTVGCHKDGTAAI